MQINPILALVVALSVGGGLRLIGRSWWQSGVTALLAGYLICVANLVLAPPQLIGPTQMLANVRSFRLREHVHLVPFRPHPLSGQSGWDYVRSQRSQLALNVLLTVPGGVLLPCLWQLRWRRIVVIGLVTGVGLELAQLASQLLWGNAWRIADSDDVLMNWLGVLAGYGLWRGLAWSGRRNGNTAEQE